MLSSTLWAAVQGRGIGALRWPEASGFGFWWWLVGFGLLVQAMGYWFKGFAVRGAAWART